MRLFIDTNVVIDLLSRREPFYKPIARIATLSETGKVIMIISSVTFVTADYVLSKFENKSVVKEKLRKLRAISEVSISNAEVIDRSLDSDFDDFEDAVQYYSALDANCQIIITEDKTGFLLSSLPVMTATKYLENYF